MVAPEQPPSPSPPMVSPFGHAHPPLDLDLACRMVGCFGLGLLRMVVHMIMQP